MILLNDFNLMTVRGSKPWGRVGTKAFHITPTETDRNFNPQVKVESGEILNIGFKDREVSLFKTNVEVMTSEGFKKISDLKVGDKVIFYAMRDTDYGTKFLRLEERAITDIDTSECLFDEMIEVSYKSLIVDGLYLKEV